MIRFFLFCFLTLSAVNAKVEWKLYRNETGHAIQLYAIIGTPGQVIHIDLDIDAFCTGLWLHSSQIDAINGFDKKKSSTFELTYQTSYYDEGDDKFQIKSSDGSTKTLNNVAFNIIKSNKSECAGSSNTWMSFNNSLPNAFLNSMFESGDEEVVVILYDDTPVSPYFTGSLTIGGRPDVCSNQWSYATPKDDEYNYWNIDVDRINADRFTAVRPGVAFLEMDIASFWLPESIYQSIADQLGVGRHGAISCSATKDLIFTVAGIDMKLTPKDYIKTVNGNCFFYGRTLSDDFSDTMSLPYTLFKNICMLFDFKNNRMGFSKRTDRTD